ncbi:MAG: hypothetical protein LQ351_000601 [Letrouitia transgressa]|nr:MAG: hypothetical protein LQ351_000601 [Letrouitia transgressa]
MSAVQPSDGSDFSIRVNGSDLQTQEVAEEAYLPQPGRFISSFIGIRMPCTDPSQLWDVKLRNGIVESVAPHGTSGSAYSEEELCFHKCLLAPSLCHPHIHLDKCFLLSDPRYSDLEITHGTFTEALELTSKAKARFGAEDLQRRGRWLVEESVAAGVTCMRAFVEVDVLVRFVCLEAGLKLKREFQHVCNIQLCVFAQDPVFSGPNGPENRKLVEEALKREGVDVLGCTPYVEQSSQSVHANVDWAIYTAMKYEKHLDIHLDYTVDLETVPVVDYAVDSLQKKSWKAQAPSKTIVFGHCTRLTLFTSAQWESLRLKIADLPVSFVGLPTSDLFMMGKPGEVEGGGQRYRGTLQIPQMIQRYGFKGSIGINNIGNAFTPQGSCDPLSVASLGVGVYQAGTKQDAELLYECVSTNAKDAVGYRTAGLEVKPGDQADFILFGPARNDSLGIRPRRTLHEIVYDPPRQRITIYQGRISLVNAWTTFA